MEVIRRKLADLVIDPANVHMHTPDNLRAIGASIAEFGFVEPLIVQKGTGKVIGGNGRVQVMRDRGDTEADVVEIEIDDQRASALAVALNRPGKLTGFDDAALAELLKSLPDDLQVAAGFDEKELAELLNSLDTGPVVEDEAPAPLPEPVSRRGDVWLMGGHRLLCGDSTDAGDVALVMKGEKAGLMLTDPPYGVSYVGKTEQALQIQNDGADGLRLLLDAAFGRAMEVCVPGAVWYVAAPAGPQHLDFGLALRDIGVLRQTLIWVKDSMVLGHSDFHYKHETIYYGWVPGPHREPPTRTCTSILEFARPKASREHPTMKPIELWAFLMSASSGLGGIVYEPFSGSGTTIIAAEQLNRRCYAIEIEPRYVDVGCRRYWKLTGKEPILESTGRTWSDTAKERGVAVG